MKIILLKDHIHLGEEGQVCEVKDGYARNYLLPQEWAVRDDAHSRHLLQQKRRSIAKRREDKRQAAQRIKDSLEGTQLRIGMRVGDTGKLYGAVTTQHIVDLLAQQGVEVDRKRIELVSHHIRRLGTYSVTVRLEQDVTMVVSLLVEDERGLVLPASAEEDNQGDVNVTEEPQETALEPGGDVLLEADSSLSSDP